jgi:hypothetical protein
MIRLGSRYGTLPSPRPNSFPYKYSPPSTPFHLFPVATQVRASPTVAEPPRSFLRRTNCNRSFLKSCHHRRMKPRSRRTLETSSRRRPSMNKEPHRREISSGHRRYLKTIPVSSPRRAARVGGNQVEEESLEPRFLASPPPPLRRGYFWPSVA